MKEAALYLEVDEDITSAIDKLSKLDGDAISIVVPKRSTMLQSIINLKLLKKAAENSGKTLSIVTNDKIATELASRVGLAVAASVGAKPVIAPTLAMTAPTNEDIIDESDLSSDDYDEPTTKLAPKRKDSVQKPAVFAKKDLTKAAVVEVAVANDETTDATTEDGDEGRKNQAKVPNFNKMRKRLLLAALAIILIGGYFGYMSVFSGANVTLYASGTRVAINEDFTVDTATGATTNASTLAGQALTVSKEIKTSFEATGKKDNGTKATGSVTIYNEYDMLPHTLVAGTRIQSTDGKVFRTKDDVTVPGAIPGFSAGRFTLNPGKSSPVDIEADANGDTYNLAAGRYTVVNYTGDQQSKIYGQASATTGGVSKIVTVVTQADIDGAKATAIEADLDGAMATVKAKVPSDYRLLSQAVGQSVTAVNSSPAVDGEAVNANLTIAISYSGVTVKESDFASFVKKLEQTEVGDNDQIYTDGLKNAVITPGPISGSTSTYNLTTAAYAGKKLDATAIADQLKGLKYGDARDAASRQPGVQNADVELTPSWSSKLPSNPSKINVTIEVATSGS